MLIRIFFKLFDNIFNVVLIELNHLESEVTVLNEVFLLPFLPDCGKILNSFKGKTTLLEGEFSVLAESVKTHYKPLLPSKE